MEQKRVLITICGRAGSKGFKNKNLKIDLNNQKRIAAVLSSLDDKIN